MKKYICLKKIKSYKTPHISKDVVKEYEVNDTFEAEMFRGPWLITSKGTYILNIPRYISELKEKQLK